MRNLIAVVSVIIIAGVSLVTSASHEPTQPTFRSNSELVVLHVGVRDRGGRYVTGLTQDAFTVIDDGKPQTLQMFSGDEVPATVGILIDNSNSMRPNRERVIASAVAFTEHSNPQDEIFVLTFNEVVRHAFGPLLIAEMDPQKFTNAMYQSVTARGMTAIYDGVLAGLSRLEHARHTRQVLIIVSDGDDNASQAKLADVVRQVHESDATVYTVALIDPILRGGNPGLLRRLAASTGGESFQPERVEDVPEAFARIAKDIRSAYTLAWDPPKTGDAAAERRRHTVRVYVKSPDGRILKVRARDGYFEKAPEPQR